VGEIAAASKEQSGGIEQVNQAITQIDQITQQNAALVEEATAAAKSLEDQSDALVQAVAIFKTAEERGGVSRNARKSQPEEHVNGSIGRHNGKALH
jgi:predicted HAD superfamily Cof-like phosphohydrolase